ncbi:hypothetical protein KL911_001405 [Ogataea haglerorum]|uniref:uncharacterized protein n=1 Tax=Ogataea haglerorum TaxID=1937702 RepID=UPI001C89C855|nr:uncharacterized protein KL911_001405 [Ogataea haglerorum]KAG7756603.1 hypothetical protein KL911_001405 [Ogataea haglerorum]
MQNRARERHPGAVFSGAGAAHPGVQHPAGGPARDDLRRHPRATARPAAAVQDLQRAAAHKVPVSRRLCGPRVLLARDVSAAAVLQSAISRPHLPDPGKPRVASDHQRVRVLRRVHAQPGDRDDRRDPADRPQTGGPARRAHVRPAVVRPRGKHPGLGGVAARRGLPVRLHRDRAVSVQKQPQSDCPRPPAGHGGLQGGVRRRPRDRLVGAQLLLPVRQRGCRADARRQPQPQLHRLRQHAAGLLRDPVQKTRRRLLSVSVPVANGWPASRRACTTINFIVWQISGTTTSFLLLHDGHEKHVDAGRAHIHRGERRCLRRVCGAFPAAPSPVQAHLPAQVQLRHRARQREAGPAAAGPADLDLCPAQEAALLRHPAGRHRRVSVSAVPVYRGLPCSRRHSHMARSAPCERHGRQGRGWARPAEHLQRQLGPQVLRPCVCVVHLLRRRAVCDLPRAALLLESAQPRAHDARVREEAQLQDGHFPDRQRPVPRRGGVFQAVRGCQAGLGGQEKQTAVARAQAQRAAHERARGRPDKAAPARRQGETQGRQKGPCHREP